MQGDHLISQSEHLASCDHLAVVRSSKMRTAIGRKARCSLEDDLEHLAFLQDVAPNWQQGDHFSAYAHLDCHSTAWFRYVVRFQRGLSYGVLRTYLFDPHANASNGYCIESSRTRNFEQRAGHKCSASGWCGMNISLPEGGTVRKVVQRLPSPKEVTHRNRASRPPQLDPRSRPVHALITMRDQHVQSLRDALSNPYRHARMMRDARSSVQHRLCCSEHSKSCSGTNGLSNSCACNYDRFEEAQPSTTDGLDRRGDDDRLRG